MGKPGTKFARLEQHIMGESEAPELLIRAYRSRLEETCDPETAYRHTIPLHHRKRFGQFFTPAAIAKIMAEWLVDAEPRSILDPAAGTGVFGRTLRAILPQASITCIDADGVALDAARAAILDHEGFEFLKQDFLTWDDERQFDAAIANPPYLRHHDLFYSFDIFSVVGRKNHVRLSRLSNVYALFILEICRRLRVGGRASVIVPGEWVNANFGETLKRWLISRGLLHTLIYFSHASLQFEDSLTTASILLLQRPAPHHGRAAVRTIFVDEDCPSEDLRSALSGTVNGDDIVVQQFEPNRLLAEKKWNALLANSHARQAGKGFVRLSEIADTRRGIATGSNSFFHLTPSAVASLHIRPENLTPCIGRAADVDGLIFTERDFNDLQKRDARTFLFDLRGEPNEAEARYVAKGEADGVHLRYLCAARKLWYEMERRLPAPIWAAVFGRAGLRFVHNAAGIANLTTFHCIYSKSQSTAFSAALTACLNSRVVQDLARRQHRVYGGGLLKFEPKDLLDIEVPDLRFVGAWTLNRLELLLERLDACMRENGDCRALMEELDAAVRGAAEEASHRSQQTCSVHNPITPNFREGLIDGI